MTTEQSNLKTWRLKIRSVKPETKPDKDGFLPMRIFGKSSNATYSLEYYDDGTPRHYSIHQATKDKDGNTSYSWFPIQDNEMKHLFHGGQLVVDELVLEIDLHIPGCIYKMDLARIRQANHIDE